MKKIFECKTYFLTIAIILFLKINIIAQVGPVVALTGTVVNRITKEPASVFISVTDEEGKKINQTKSNAAENGYFFVTSLRPGKKYTITLKQKNYFLEKINIEVPNTSKYLEMSHDFQVIPLEVGANIKFQVSPFELNKAKIRIGSELLMDEIKNTLKNNPEVKFQISCFPDNNKDAVANKELTQERVKSIMNFLVTNGVDAGRISTKANDSTDPANPPPVGKESKGKKYIGSSYIVVSSL